MCLVSSCGFGPRIVKGIKACLISKTTLLDDDQDVQCTRVKWHGCWRVAGEKLPVKRLTGVDEVLGLRGVNSHAMLICREQEG